MWVHEHTPALQGPQRGAVGRRAGERGQTWGIHTPQPGHVPGSLGHRQHLGRSKRAPLFLLLSLSPLPNISPQRDLALATLNFGKKRKSGQVSHPTSFSSSCLSFTPKHICDNDISVMMHRASLTDLSKALPTPSCSSLGALVVLGTEEEEQGLLSFPFVGRAAEVRGWRGKAARTEQGRRRCPGRGCGEGSAGEKALPCHGASQGHAGHGSRGAEPSAAPQNHRSVLSPRPRPAQRCSPRRAPAVGMLAPSGDTRGRGGSRALTPPRPGMPCPSSPSTHLHSPSEGGN